MARINQISIATGTMGVGKTYATCHMIDKYIQTAYLKGGELRKGRKVLIYDVNREFNDVELQKMGVSFRAPILSIEDLPKWTRQRRVEVRRILPLEVTPDGRYKMSKDNGVMVATLNRILKEFGAGLLILEDINGYLIGATTEEIISTITRVRHSDLDIYIHYQSLSPMYPRMWQNASVIRLHKQNDDIGKYKGKLNNPELFYIATRLVDNKYKTNERFYCFVQLKMEKIYGNLFTKEDFQLACYTYLMEFPQRVNKAKNFYADIKDKKIQREKAMEHCIMELMKYYGNKEKPKLEFKRPATPVTAGAAQLLNSQQKIG